MRDKNGKFVKGGNGGPGRPSRDTELDYLKTMRDVVSRAEWTQICQKALADAKNGNAAARKWLGNYLLGVPEGGLPALSLIPNREHTAKLIDEFYSEAMRS